MKSKKPKHNRLGKKSLFAIFILITLLVAVSAFVIADRVERNRLDKSMNNLKAALESKGFQDVDKFDDCMKTQVKYGEGTKVCSLMVSFRADNIHYKTAGEKYQEFNEVVQSSGFSLIGQMHEYDVANGIDFGTNYYLETSTDTNCGSHHKYESSDLKQGIVRSETGTLLIDLSCNL